MIVSRRVVSDGVRKRDAISVVLATLMMIAGSSAQAQQAADPAELAFWQSVTRTGSAAEYQAYLEAYPQGQFAALARQRLQGTAPAVVPAPHVTAVDRPQASLRPVQATIRLTDGITLDINAEALQSGSNLRLAVVPAGTPDVIADPAALVANSTPIRAARLHMTIPSGSPGRDEVRLYYIPTFQAEYVLAGRATVTVAPGVPGATLTRDLAREMVQLGPIRFEANHRDRPMLVQAAFLRVQPRTEWNTHWVGAIPGGVSQHQILILSIGQPGVARDEYGSTGDAVCALVADDPAVLDRVASLQLGDPVTVVGIPTSWDSAGPSDPVLLRQCALR